MKVRIWITGGFFVLVFIVVAGLWQTLESKFDGGKSDATAFSAKPDSIPTPDVLRVIQTPLQKIDTSDYKARLSAMVHHKTGRHWPVEAPVPLDGSLLPFHRIVAFYGNFLSPRMGILGSIPEVEMIAQLKSVMIEWEVADPETPVLPALHYIAVTAQGQPGRDSLFRLRMPDKEIQRAVEMAQRNNALLFLDIQPGHSRIADEVRRLETFLLLPFVHIGLDPEYAMQENEVPGQKIGSLDAAEINEVAAYIAGLVRREGLPPKVLIIHCFTREMITRYNEIQLHPQVQIVIHMDGFGSPAKKRNSYRLCVEKQPVQFTGFKLFFRQDRDEQGQVGLMSAREVLSLYPRPLYIQYQ